MCKNNSPHKESLSYRVASKGWVRTRKSGVTCTPPRNLSSWMILTVTHFLVVLLPRTGRGGETKTKKSSYNFQLDSPLRTFPTTIARISLWSDGGHTPPPGPTHLSSLSYCPQSLTRVYDAANQWPFAGLLRVCWICHVRSFIFIPIYESLISLQLGGRHRIPNVPPKLMQPSKPIAQLCSSYCDFSQFPIRFCTLRWTTRNRPGSSHTRCSLGLTSNCDAFAIQSKFD